MSTFTIGGVSTGIDYNDLISKLIAVQRQPINVLENKKYNYNEKISAYDDILTRLSTLQSAADDLRTSSNFYTRAVSVSDSTVFEATASSSASTGNYSISVTQLAQAHKITHNTGLSDKDTTTVLASGNTFEFTINGETKTITASSDLTLEQLASEINSQTYTGDVEVEASVINTGTSSSPSYKLILKSNTVGGDYGITINQDDSILDLTDTEAADSDSDGQYRVELQAAQDAEFTVDGLSVTRSSNTVSDVITGVTLTLKKSGSGSLSVTPDGTAIKEKIESFVSAYNDVMSFISTNSAYDTSTHVRGTLTGEGTARSIQSRLRGIVSSSVSGLTEDFRLLAQIGITTDTDKTDGTLSIDTSILEDKLASNIDDVANLFADASEGIAQQMYDYADSVTDSIDGSVTLRKDGLEDMIDNVDDTITRMNLRLERIEQDLVRRFTALETLINGFNTQGDFLSNQVALFSKKI